MKADATKTPTPQVDPETGETPKQFAARTRWWREAKFGMFIHWGIYAVPADGEWHMYAHQMQVPDYEKYATQFEPVKFDAARWVHVAKAAGMKYIVITSKHHDGFCMFDTKLSDYSIVKATLFKRDPMRELAAQCKKQRIRLCFYHSIMDWHHPDYLPRRPWEKDLRPAVGASLDRYLEYMKGQLRELLTNYGPIGVIWFDGGWEHGAEELHAKEVVKMIRTLQPGIMINNRINLPEDFDTPEQSIPASALKKGRLWETCMTLNNNWGYARKDRNWKSPEDLVHKLCDIASKGGNFLLNVGPTALGEVPQESVERLERVGQWMKLNGESIYGTTQSPFKRLPFEGRATVKGKTLYLQVFRWPAEGLKLKGLKNKVIGAKALDSGETLAVTKEADALSLAKPVRLDEFATVVALRLNGPPVVEEPALVIAPQADGSFALTALQATIEGETAQVEPKADNVPNIGYWTNANDTVCWRISVPRVGAYRVVVEFACPQENAGSTYTIGVDGTEEKVTATVTATGDWAKFRTETLDGVLHLRAGEQTLRVTPQTMPRGAVMNLRLVCLKPA